MKKAFTIVELLVVIGIMALLMSLVLSAISKAKHQAGIVSCSSNLGQIGKALIMSTHDRQGYMPLAGVLVVPTSTFGYGSLPVALNDTGRRRYVYVKERTIATSMGEHVASPTMALSKHLGIRTDDSTEWPPRSFTEVSKVFRCPSENSEERADPIIGIAGSILSMFFYPGDYSDYAFNQHVFGFDRVRGSLAGRLSSVRDTSVVVLLADADCKAPGGATICWTVATDGRISLEGIMDGTVNGPKVTTRHRGRMNCLFADGHVEALATNALGHVILREK